MDHGRTDAFVDWDGQWLHCSGLHTMTKEVAMTSCRLVDNVPRG